MQNEPHTTTADHAKLQAIIADLATDPDLRLTVNSIENQYPTSQNHYDRYLLVLSPLADTPNTCRMFALAMMKAGANKQGIQSALQILGLG